VAVAVAAAGARVRVIGLTGGIAMGKSTVAAALRRARIPVFDADAAVRALQAPGGAALPAIAAAFPGTVAPAADGRLTLDRAALRRVVLADPAGLARLEAILHPLVRRREAAFLAAARRRRARLAVLDVPLLFESRGRAGIDLVVAVSAPAAIQRARVRARGVLTEAQLDAILRRQWPDARRRRAADRVVRTGLSRHHALSMIGRIVQHVSSPRRSRA
jgi:dephospho-CoA kinase